MSLKTKVVGLDLDDVLASLLEDLNNYHNLTYNSNYTIDDYHTWGLESIWNCSDEEAVKRVFDFFYSAHMDDIKPVAGAKEVVDLLAEKYSLVVITSRPLELEPKTHKWLEQYFPQKFSDIVHTNQFNRQGGNTVTKGEICKKLNVEFFVDDALHNIQDVAESQITSYLFDRPWNRGLEIPEKVTRVFCWEEIGKQLGLN